ncbi:phosphoethanolamine N-methyltransferase-like isoform X2 [Gigantopelta aegis]|nr:phosphoethanolamine N-methyltransferase-like isoform X2 [Gigantopelta aegis]
MTQYWQQHASDSATVVEMMLDHDAEKLHEEEMPEILSYLPDYTGMRILELGAGIGRFTSMFATKAKSVTAVDFMEEFIEKNKETNEHHDHVDFHVADVTHLEKEPHSYDLVFTNWLLMYLSDKEVQELVKKILTWLDDDGYFFIRESCHHSSGNKLSKDNPTHYRDPVWYEAMFNATTADCDGKHCYGFDLVLSRSVDIYIKNKNNVNQVIWLMQKVKRETTTSGYKTFQEFLDNQQYSLTGILRYEQIFGKTFISTGGLETTKKFVKQLKLKKGDVVLDVGCGIGGSAFYMAKEHGAKVVGVDLSSNMINVGIQRAKELGVSFDQVSFEIADATKRQYPPGSFDVIYSRDTILHIPDKLSLFKNFYKWLKPGGKVLISDYCCSDGEHSDIFKQYVKQRGYKLLSPPEYGKVLEAAGFSNVRAEDKTDLFVSVLKGELSRTEMMEKDFVAQFSQEDYDDIVNGWKSNLYRVGLGDQKWGLFYAEKV